MNGKTYWERMTAKKYASNYYFAGTEGGIQIHRHHIGDKFWFSIYVQDPNNPVIGDQFSPPAYNVAMLRTFILLPCVQQLPPDYNLSIQDTGLSILITITHNTGKVLVAQFDCPQWQAFVDYVNEQTPSMKK